MKEKQSYVKKKIHLQEIYTNSKVILFYKFHNDSTKMWVETSIIFSQQQKQDLEMRR